MANASWKRVTGAQVSVVALPAYVGPSGYLASLATVLARLRLAVRMDDAAILRIPSHVANSIEMILRWRHHPYGAEVVGDASAVFAPGAIGHWLRFFLRWFTLRTVRRQCRNACAIAYVTEYTLQRQFPPSPNAFTTHYSSVELPDESIATMPRATDGTEIKLISVGSMELKYKRFDVLIEAVKRCVATGLNLRLALIGDGRSRAAFELAAQSLGDRVSFLGELPGSEAVCQELLKADLFVFPSTNEGLPRAVIEAMAVGLPCIATTVGGTPELLAAEDMVPPGDVDALTAKIQEIAGNPARMRAMSARNLQVARQYANSELNRRRTNFYRYVREYTEEWNKRR